MRTATKTAVVTVSALAAVLAITVAAYAGTATLQGTLKVSPSGGHYDDEITMTPSMNATAYPGDIVDIEYLTSKNTWEKYGESLSVEDTVGPDAVSGLTTVGPLAFVIDGSLQYPAVVRAHFTPKDSAQGTEVSDPVWVRMIKNTRTKVILSAPKTVTHGKQYAIASRVTPNSGVGRISVKVKRLPSGTPRVYTIETDESGLATFTFIRSNKGRYSITQKFLGNRFGAASPSVTKTIVVK